MSNGTVLWNLEHASSGSTRAIARLVRRITGAGALVLLMLLASTDRAEAQCRDCGEPYAGWMNGVPYVRFNCDEVAYPAALGCVNTAKSRGGYIETECRTFGVCRRGQGTMRVHTHGDLWAWTEVAPALAPRCAPSSHHLEGDTPNSAPVSVPRVTLVENE